MEDEKERPRGFTKIEKILENFNLQDHEVGVASSVAQSRVIGSPRMGSERNMSQKTINSLD